MVPVYLIFAIKFFVALVAHSNEKQESERDKVNNKITHIETRFCTDFFNRTDD